MYDVYGSVRMPCMTCLTVFRMPCMAIAVYGSSRVASPALTLTSIAQPRGVRARVRVMTTVKDKTMVTVRTTAGLGQR